MAKTKLKCIKCGLRYKDRGPDDISGFQASLCWNCGLIWKMFGYFLVAIPEKLNREVVLVLDHFIIRKKRHGKK